MARKLVATKDNTITSQGTEPLSREVARPIFGENVLAIDYNFAEKGYLDDDIDFTRNTGATQTNSEGLVAFAPHNELQYSEDLSNNWWQSNSPDVTTVRSTTIKDPFGGYNAHEVTVDSTSNPHIARVNVNANPSNRNVVKSIYARTVSGTIDQVSLLGLTHASHRVSLTEEWQRFSLLNDTTTGHFYLVDFRGNTSNVVGTKILLYGAQQEQTFDGNPTDFIKTTDEAYQAPRLDHVPETGERRGLLIEEGRTNFVPYSQDLSHSDWIKTNSTIATSGETDPSGGTGAYKLTLNASNSGARISDTFNSTAGEHTFSVYVKKGTASDIRVGFNDEGTAGRTLDFNLDTGQIIQTSGADNTFVQDCGNGWHRIGVSGNIAASGSDTFFLRGFTTNSNTSSGDYVHIFGAQMEKGSFPTSLIPTYGDTADRAADIASVSGTAFSRFFKDTEGTFVVDAQAQRGFVSDNQSLFSASDSSASDHIRMYISTSEKPVALVRTLNSGEASISTNVDVSSGEIFTSAFGYKTNNARAFTDHVTSNLDTNVDLPTNLIELTIGHRYNNIRQLNGWIRRLRYFNKRKSDSQLQNLVSQDKLLQRFKGAKAAHSLRALTDFDKQKVTRIRREYDSYEADYTANQVANGDLEKDFRSADQTTLPLDISVEADEMIVGGDFTDLITNGDFASASGWTTSGGATIESGTANWDGSQSSWAIVRQDSILPASGSTVTATFTVSNYSAGILYVRAGALATATQVTANGTYALTLPVSYSSAGDNQFRFQGDLNFVGSVDNVSVVEGGWVLDNGFSFGSGTLNRAAENASFAQVVSMPVKVGKTYDVSLDIVNHSTGTNYITFGGHYLTKTQSANGHYTYRLTATSTQKLGFYAGTNAVYSIDNVSVKEVNPIATGFSTRKIDSSYTGKAMRCRNQGNVEVEVGFDDNDEISLSSPVTNTSQNLLAYSEDFGQWGYHSTYTPTLQKGIADPFGGNNAGLLTAAGSNNASQVKNDNLSLTSGTYYTASLYIKKGTSTKTRLGIYQGGWIFWAETTFDASGIPSSTGNLNATNISYEKIGDDGWYRFSFVGKATATASNHSLIFYPDRNATNKNTYIFGAQLEETQYESTPSGSEITTNGTFDDGITGWGNGGNNFRYDSSSKRIERFAGTDNSTFFQTIPIVAGKKYKLEYDVTHVSGNTQSNTFINTGGGYITIGNTFGSASVSTEFTAVTTQNMALTIYSIGDFRGFFDNVSVKELANLSPSTYAQTPVISNDGSNTTATTLGDFAGKENLLDYSEDFSQWANSSGGTGSNAIFVTGQTDPNGGTGATRVTFNKGSGSSASDLSVISETFTSQANVSSVYIRSDSPQRVVIRSSSTWIGVDTTTEWTRVSHTDTGGSFQIGLRDGYGISNVPDTAEVYLWGAQVNTNSLKTYQATTSTALTGDVNVVNWYNQGGGGGEDATQDTASKQPRIVMGSELVTDSGGKASLYFDGGDTLQNSTLAGQNRLDIYAIQDTSDDPYLYPADPTNGSNFAAVADDGSGESNIEDNFGTPSYYVNGALQSFSDRDDVHDALTGSTKLFSQHNASTSSWGNLEVGHYGGSINSTYNYTGKISEMVFFPNMDSSPKRFPIEQNMLRHFKPYVLNDPFDDNSNNWSITATSPSTNVLENGAVTATVVGTSNNYTKTSILTGTASDRLFDYDTNFTYRLTVVAQGTSGGQIRFRDDTSNNGGLTTSNGVVTLDGTLQTFVFEWQPNDNSDELVFERHTGDQTYTVYDLKLEQIGVDGFINTLYDQTGNNCHALQATAARQPKIVSGGDLIKSGGHPAWEHVTASNMLMEGKIQAAHLDAWFVAETNDNTYMYPANYATVSDHGFVSQDGSTSVALIADYGGGDAKLYANGNLIGSSGSNTRDEVHTALNGRKLVHHQDADTADWAKLQMGYYGSTSNSTFNFQGKFSEWIWYDSSQSSNRTSIDTAINTHYNIY